MLNSVSLWLQTYHVSLLTLLCLQVAAQSIAESTDSLSEAKREVRSNAQTIVSATRIGDFETAWEEYLLAIDLALIDTSVTWTFSQSCKGQWCQSLGALGGLRGKALSDLPSVKGGFEGQDERTREHWLSYVQRFMQHEYLNESPRPATLAPQRIPLVRARLHPDDPRPWTYIREETEGRSQAAVIGTGAVYDSVFEEHVVQALGLNSQVLGQQFVSRDFQGHESRARWAILRGLKWGGLHDEPLPVSLVREADRRTLAQVVLGMHLLLRYSAVCFHWEERVLFLGELGPCSRTDLTSLSAKLHPQGLVPSKRVSKNTRESVLVVFDTGSSANHCKLSLSESLAESSIELFQPPKLRVSCNRDAAVVREGYPFDMVIGMETLGRFAAFGWKLNPFRLYFVPNAEEF